MKKQILIEALDTLFFRDGKPFTMGAETFAEGIFPPLPSTIRGALRTAYFAEHPDELHKAGTEDDPTGKKYLKITGIRYFYDGRVLYPLPKDLVEKKDKSHSDKQYEQKEDKYEVLIQSLIANDFSEGYAYSLYSDEQVESFDGFLAALDFEDEYQNDEEDVYKAIKVNIVEESKIGIGRDRKYGSVAEGKLYRTMMSRTQNIAGGLMKTLGILVDLEAESESFFEKGIIRLGGEGRVAKVKTGINSKSENKSLNLDSQYFKIYLLTPAICGEKALIDFEDRLSGIKIKLLTASTGKHRRVGGFDMKRREPKKMYAVLPHGSVFYYKIEGEHTLKDILEVLQEIRSVSFQNKDDGFGLYKICDLDFENRLKSNYE